MLNGWAVKNLYDVPVLNEVQLRWPMALAGVLGILAIFLAVRKMSGVIPGLIAAAITCFSYYHIYYSREARYYSFFFLAAVWIIHAAYNCINSKSSRLPWKSYLIYSIAAVFGLGIHQGCYFLVAITNTYLMIWECLRAVQYLLQRTMKLSKVSLRLAVVLFFLLLPMLTCWPTISATFAKVTNSVQTTSVQAKLIDDLNFKTFVDLQTDYWENLVNKKTAIFLLVLPLLLIFCKRYWHILILYIIIYITPLFTLSFTDKSLFDTFRSKYLIFIFVMSVISVSIAIAFIIDILRRLIKYKRWNTYIKISALILLSLISIAGLHHIYNKKLDNPRYARLYRNHRKGPQYLYSYLIANASSNDFIIGKVRPWRSDWQNYMTKRSGLDKINKIYFPSSFHKEINEEIFLHPHKVWYVLDYDMPSLSNNKLNKKFVFNTFAGTYTLVHTKKPCFTKRELVESTMELYKAYYVARRTGNRGEIYGEIANKLESWLNKQKPYSSNTLAIIKTQKNIYSKNISLLSLSSIKISDAFNFKLNTSKIEFKNNKYNQSILIIPKPVKDNIITISFSNEFSYNIFEFKAFIDVKNKWPYEIFEVYGDGQLLNAPVKIRATDPPRKFRYIIAGRNIIQMKIKVGRRSYYEKIILANPILKRGTFNWHDIKNITSTNFYKMVFKKDYRKGNIVFKNALVVVPTPDGTPGNILIPLNKKYERFSTQISVDVNNPNPYETITIYGDNKKLDYIKKIGPNTPPVCLKINTKDVDLLRIEVAPGHKGYYEKIIFFDAKFEPKEFEK